MQRFVFTNCRCLCIHKWRLKEHDLFSLQTSVVPIRCKHGHLGKDIKNPKSHIAHCADVIGWGVMWVLSFGN